MVDKTSIDIALRAATDRGEVAGVVAMSAAAAGTLYEGSFGTTDLATGAAMRPDAIFRLASMTKAITSVAAMQLVEQGRLALDAPIAAVLPHLADRQVLAGFADDGTPRLRPAAGPVTLRQLLTHSAGYSYEFWNPDYTRMCQGLGIAPLPGSHDELARIPLLFDPGTAWNYGINTDIVGLAVEAASGKRLDVALADGVCGMLGMNETGFEVPAERRARMATTRTRAPNGTLGDAGFPMDRGIRYCMGGGGLQGTGRDYLRFIRMVLNGGMHEGTRVLSPAMMAEVARNQLAPGVRVRRMVSGNPARSNDAEFFPGMEKHWSAAFMINAEPAPTGRNAGSLAWAGIANTYCWIDQKAGVGGVFMAQLLPFADPAVLDGFAAFERAVYELVTRQ